MRARHVLASASSYWVPLYSFTSEPVHASDVQMANHFTATHPSSPFVNRLVAMRRHAHHRIRLLGRTLQTTRSDGSHFEQNLSEEELGDILANEFDIHLTDRERSELTH
ncbi:MAG: arylamine N-acetyltransferase [Nocardioidaceae bacterium]